MSTRIYPPNNASTGKFGLGLAKIDVQGAPRQRDNVRLLGKDLVDSTLPTDFFPTYQLGICRNTPYYTSETALVWIQTAADAIYRRVLPFGARLVDCPAATVDVDLSGMGALDQQTAFTVVERLHNNNLPHVVMALPAAAGGGDYGILVYSSTGVTVAPVAPTFTTAQLFPPGNALGAPAGGYWRTFAGFETSEYRIRILASLVTTPGAIAGARDQAYSMLVTFEIDPALGTITSPAALVSSDIVFDPHQIAAGKTVPLNGQPPTTKLWCAGRAAPNMLLRSGQTGSASPAYPVGVANAGGSGIWVCDSPDTMQDWRRVAFTPHSHDQNPEEIQTGQDYAVATLRAPPVFDVGVLFDPSWQRLQFVGVGTDPTQDPHLTEPYEI